ncbi:hypothetical protein EXN66_Car004955 [Channa argus]|uniref:Uncharacterized protein n=1 Tax=Channa argus TaxID=215402 RepID=A0A6G1PGG5_CHAAH|nr:hypothetical protein EXN66_Car004955 [Channa argus]
MVVFFNKLETSSLHHLYFDKVRFLLNLFYLFSYFHEITRRQMLFEKQEMGGKNGEFFVKDSGPTTVSSFHHITPILQQLHWLPVKYRIEFKILLYIFKAIHNLSLSYLSDVLHIATSSRSVRSSSST